jgi:hypothetical protein
MTGVVARAVVRSLTPRPGRRSRIAGLFSLAAIALISASLISASLVAVGGLVDQDPAQAQSATPTQPGFRVYVVVLDGLMPHEVDPTLTPNLSELKEGGTWYEQARAVFPAETLPNHAAMMTGVQPTRNGIVGNDFLLYEEVGTERTRMQYPSLLGADTLTTRLENRCTVSTATVQSKGYLYGLFHDEAAPTTQPLNNHNPQVHDQPNADHPGLQRQADFHWSPFNQPGYIDDPDDHALDQSVMNFGFLPWVRSGPPTPQFAFVNLGDIDRAGHIDESNSLTNGGVSAFRQSAIGDTDAVVGEFVDELKETGAWEETVLIFTSDHGMDWSDPEDEDAKVDIGGQLTANGYSGSDFIVVGGGGTAAVYPRSNSGAGNFDLAGMAKAIAAHPGVDFVATPHSIPELDNPTLRETGMDHRYNGRIVAFVKDNWAVRSGVLNFNNPIPGNHGHSVTQQSVLMVAGGHEVLDEQPESVGGPPVYDPSAKLFSPPASGPGNLSVAPTVAALFGIGEPPGGYDAPPLSEAFDSYALAPHPACEAATQPTGKTDGDSGQQGGSTESPPGGSPTPGEASPPGPTQGQAEPSRGAAKVTVSAANRQRLSRRGLAVKVRATLPGVVTARGVVSLPNGAAARRVKLPTVRRSLTKAGTVTLRLRISRAGHKAITRALRRRRSLPARVTVSFRATDGRKDTATKRLRIVR